MELLTFRGLLSFRTALLEKLESAAADALPEGVGESRGLVGGRCSKCWRFMYRAGKLLQKGKVLARAHTSSRMCVQRLCALLQQQLQQPGSAERMCTNSRSCTAVSKSSIGSSCSVENGRELGFRFELQY